MAIEKKEPFNATQFTMEVYEQSLHDAERERDFELKRAKDVLSEIYWRVPEDLAKIIAFIATTSEAERKVDQARWMQILKQRGFSDAEISNVIQEFERSDKSAGEANTLE